MHGNKFIRYGGYSDLKIVVINSNLSILIIYKNSPGIINTRSSFTSILYLCKTIFKDYYVLYKHFNN